MNIIVKPYGKSACYCRPDTTWERENKDYYAPECVNGIHWSPIVFARISKAGKCIGKKFATRYYDAFNYGALLYCLTDESDDIAFTSCSDHTSLLPAPLYNVVVMEGDENTYEVRKDDEVIFRTTGSDIAVKGMIEEAICTASQMTSLRIGDFIAVELAPKGLIVSRVEGQVGFKAKFCENELFDLKLIF